MQEPVPFCRVCGASYLAPHRPGCRPEADPLYGAGRVNPFYPVRHGDNLRGFVDARDMFDAHRQANDQYGPGSTLGVAYPSLERAQAREGLAPCWSCRGHRATHDRHGNTITCRVCGGTGQAASPPRGNPRGGHRCGVCGGPTMDVAAGTADWCKKCRAECHCSRGYVCTACTDRIERRHYAARGRTVRRPARKSGPKNNPKAKKIHALAQVVNNVPVASCGAKQGLVSADPHAITCMGCRQRGIAKNARQRAQQCARNPRRGKRGR